MPTISQPASKLIYLDIETASGEKSYELLQEKNPKLASCYIDKYEVWKNGRPQDSHKSISELYTETSALVPEFGQIVCISLGIELNKEGETVFEKKSYVLGKGAVEKRIYCETEKELITKFIVDCIKIKQIYKKDIPCGFNINKFDFPFLWRRGIINKLGLPLFLFNPNAKPWERTNLDLYSVYCAGHSYGANLDTVTTLFGLPSPKDNGIHGAEVSQNFYDGNIDKIADYCEGDIACLPNMVRAFNDIQYFD